MAIKLLENTGIENTGIGASALNNLIAGNKSGIVGNYLNECAFTATGNTIIIDKGLLIICGRQVELDAIESITLSSVPSEDVRYQIVVELIREESGEVTASIFARQPSTLIQENLMKDGFVYQFELGRVTHKKTGQVAEVLRTADILYGQSGAVADIEVGEVTTVMVDTNIPAEVNINKVLDDGKTKLNFDFVLPKPYDENVTDLVSAVTTTGNPVNIQNTNDGFVDKVKITNDTASAISSPLTGKSIGTQLFDKNLPYIPSAVPGIEATVLPTGVRVTSTRDYGAGAYTSVAFVSIDLNYYKGKTMSIQYNKDTSGGAPGGVVVGRTNESGSTRIYDLGIESGFTVPNIDLGDDHYLIIRLYCAYDSSISAGDYVDYNNLMLILGTSEQPYSGYAPTEFSIPLKDTSGTVLDLNPADVIEIIDGKYHLNSTELADESQDALRSIPTKAGQTNLIGDQPFTFNVTEFQLGLESIDAMLTLPDGTRVNVITKDRLIYITSGEYKGKTLDYVLQEIKQYVDIAIAGISTVDFVKQPNRTYVVYAGSAGTNNLYLSAATYAHTYAVAGAYLITISGTGSSATVDWGDGTSGTVDFTGGFKINNQADKDKYIEVHLGTNCAVISSSAFTGCSGLTSVTIPDSVTSIGDYAFWGCSGLTSVTIPNSVTSIDAQAFRNCSGLTSVIIPDSVTSIGGSAFRDCTKLTSVTISDSVTSIGNYAFGSCSGLTSITIPNSVTSIGSYAFEGCSGLTSVTIPDSVTSIGGQAFRNCSGLTSINFMGSTIPTISSGAFEGCRIADIIAQTSALADSAATAITTAGGTLFTNYRKLY